MRPNVQEAIAFCRSLTIHKNEQDYAWAYLACLIEVKLGYTKPWVPRPMDYGLGPTETQMIRVKLRELMVP